GNWLTRVDDAATASAYNNGFEFKDAVKQDNEYTYDKNGNMTKDLNKDITDIQYNYLNSPSQVTFKDGSTITYTYAVNGTKLRTVHKIGNTTTTTDYCGNVIYENGEQKLLLTEAGHVTLSDKKYHYYLQDHQGNNRVVVDQTGQKEEVNHYYPFGGTFASAEKSIQPYKYNGKELDTKNGLNWYDYGARYYDAAIGRWNAVDPMAEKYYEWSPYTYCGNNPVNRIDPDGRDWYQNNETKYYSWYDGHEEREGYRYIGGKGSVLGEFESIIDGILTDPKGFKTRSIYSEGFTFDIAPNDKGGLLASKERGWDFFDEFANGVGPEFSVLTSNHPYTEAMKTDKKVLQAQERIASGETDVPGQMTNISRKWSPLNVFGTTSMAKQFIGSYRYDAFTSSDGATLNNVISDSKNRTSLFLHLPFSNRSRSQARAFSNTYQFYIWKSLK
ncbi:MAG TPA: RHS repeat-associated core domain-containing protein, partial [Bacteroides reticulotermitis]|nr:RHS repeat-associated core domain-containing protein [Bacteroides reticulotermitis]